MGSQQVGHNWALVKEAAGPTLSNLLLWSQFISSKYLTRYHRPIFTCSSEWSISLSEVTQVRDKQSLNASPSLLLFFTLEAYFSSQCKYVKVNKWRKKCDENYTVYSVYSTAVAKEILNQLVVWGMNHLLYKFYLRYTICFVFFF